MLVQHRGSVSVLFPWFVAQSLAQSTHALKAYLFDGGQENGSSELGRIVFVGVGGPGGKEFVPDVLERTALVIGYSQAQEAGKLGMVLKLSAEIITILAFTRNRGSRKTMDLNLNQITLTT